jgi:hypothetical protein
LPEWSQLPADGDVRTPMSLYNNRIWVTNLSLFWAIQQCQWDIMSFWGCKVNSL